MALSKRQDTALKIVTALVVFVAVTLALEATGTSNGSRLVFRVASAVVILAGLAQWVRGKLQQHRDEAARRAGQWPEYRPYQGRE